MSRNKKNYKPWRKFKVSNDGCFYHPKVSFLKRFLWWQYYSGWKSIVESCNPSIAPIPRLSDSPMPDCTTTDQALLLIQQWERAENRGGFAETMVDLEISSGITYRSVKINL